MESSNAVVPKIKSMSERRKRNIRARVREHGKRAVTRYEFVNDRLVALWPETGRTHQLRMHCAHPDGLCNPIVGDELYGTSGQRLCLHAAEIWFTHPVTHEEMHLNSPIPF